MSASPYVSLIIISLSIYYLSISVLFTVVKALRRKENEQEPFDRNRTVFKDWKCPTEKDL